MRWDARKDENHAEIVAGLKQACRSVAETHRLGGGFPDLLVGFGGKMWLFEVKTKEGKLQKSQLEFFETWRGPKPIVVRTLEEALEATK